MFRWLGSFTEIDGKRRQLLKQKKIYRPLLIPPYASLKLSYGVNSSALLASEAAEEYSVEYKASLKESGIVLCACER